MTGWQVWVDTGGTFTDCLALSPNGDLRRCKVLSSSALRGRIDSTVDDLSFDVVARWPEAADFCRGFGLRILGEQEHTIVTQYDPKKKRLRVTEPLAGLSAGVAIELFTGEEAPVLAARVVTETPADQPLPQMSMRLATTRGTNALLERKGAPTALFVTKGFGDLLLIGDQQRPDLFALQIEKPAVLYTAVVEVDERLDAQGQVQRKLDPAQLAPRIRKLVEAGVRSAAIALVHAYRNPSHELDLAAFLIEQGMEHVSISSQLAPLIKILPRAQTAVVDAYLTPVVGAYLDRVESALGGQDLHVMTSAGGLTQRADYRTKDSLLSGPAGGVAGAAEAARRAGFERILTFDMGGTSTDVARYDGDFDYNFEHRVGDAHLVAPALAIETVAAGGGSICSYSGGQLRVGPESAGAHPGPACYGAGGPLTVTDANLLLGRLDATQFEIPVSIEAAQAALDQLQRQMRDDRSGGADASDHEVLAGLIAIADDRMAAAIRRVSLERGVDPTQFALVSFGGAGGQHACGVASRLGIDRVLIPTDAGLLSARGLGAAAIERFAERQVLRLLSDIEEDLPTWFDELAAQSKGAIVNEGVPASLVAVRRRLLNLRLKGQESTIVVDADGGPPAETFVDAYVSLYGHAPPSRPIEVESMRVVASTDLADVPVGRSMSTASGPQQRRVWAADGWCEVDAWPREALEAAIEGPGLIFERHSATFVAAGWTASVDDEGSLLLECTDKRSGAETAGTPQPEAVRLALFTHALESIAREMGTALQRTALSTNVKERLDFSCGVLDGVGRLVVNAPHIPVHLGALGLCVRTVSSSLELKPGDTAITNHPGYGGSHLPDVTLVTPVHGETGRLLAWVASRAHHAEIGGTRPGSMPPDATRLAQEGVVIAPRHLVREEHVLLEDLEALLASADCPSRAIDENLADLEAALAANHRGRAALQDLALHHGEDVVAGHMDALRQEAAAGVRHALGRLAAGVYGAREELDDGTPLEVSIEVDGDTARIDFGGSGDVHPGNLNATPAIVYSALTYVLRLLVQESLPLNEGLLEPVEIVIPPGILSPPFDTDEAPAVGGGNVETSQRLVDTLLKAFGLMAGSQGTMNNTLFGNESFGYYETVCGGTGAGRQFAGADAVHSHMTNTRITDVEIVERRYPVRIERFEVRTDSGGQGRWCGGEGCVRELTFLQDMSLSLLTQHRNHGTHGLDGGEAGAPGRQRWIRADGTVRELKAIDGVEVGPGDRLIMETPGGGGYGAVEASCEKPEEQKAG